MNPFSLSFFLLVFLWVLFFRHRTPGTHPSCGVPDGKWRRQVAFNGPTVAALAMSSPTAGAQHPWSAESETSHEIIDGVAGIAGGRDGERGIGFARWESS